jgi:TonB family protein
MDASKIFEQQRAKEQKSLRRFLLYGGAGSLILHGWLLGQSVLLPKPAFNESQEDAIELTVIEPPPDLKLPEEPPPPPPPEETRVEPEPVAVVPQIPTLDTPTPDPPKSNNDTLDKTESKVNNDEVAVRQGKPNPAPNPLDGIYNGNPNSTGNTNSWCKILGNCPPPKPAAPAAVAPAPPPPAPPPAPRKREKIRCVENCRAVYPDALRGKNVQGEAKVVADTDANGNVTNVRLVRSSGNAELDAATLEQAKKTRVNAAGANRQGLPVRVDFQIEGSDYQRQSQERQRQREAERAVREQQQEVAPAPVNPPTPAVTAPAPNPVEAPAAKRDTPAPEPAAAPPEPVAPPPAPTVEAPPPDPVYDPPAAPPEPAPVEAPPAPEPAPAPEAAPPPAPAE